MNQANVDALTAVIESLKDASSDESPNDWWDSRTLAQMLAMEGVLVPAALTDAELAFTLARWADPAGLRRALERIARGDHAD